MAKTCRYFGISRPTFYVWLKRYKNKGREGLLDLSKKPKNSPRATDPFIIKKIIKLRKQLQYSPKKIIQELNKTHSVKISGKTVYLYLRKHKLNQFKMLKTPKD